jgi:hypothetical protein
MSERLPVEPEKAKALRDDDEPDVEGHLLDSQVEKTRLNPDDDALDESDKARYKKF